MDSWEPDANNQRRPKSPGSEVSNSLFVYKAHHTVQRGEGSVNISLWLFILVGTKAASSVWTEEESIGQTLHWVLQAEHLAQRAEPVSAALPPASGLRPPPSPRSESAVETHSGCVLCCRLSILATDFDEMKWPITKRFFLFPIYALRVLLNIQRGLRFIKNKKERGGKKREGGQILFQ